MKKQIVSAGLFLCLFSFAHQMDTKQSCYKPPVKKSVINFNVDDVVTHFYVNGNEMPLNMNENEQGNWLHTHTMSMYLYPGDTITIAGKNKGGAAGIVGTLQYYNPAGILKLIHTSSTNGWLCNDKPPVVQGVNDGTSFPYLPCVDSQAQWIWGDSVPSDTYCYYTIKNNY